MTALVCDTMAGAGGREQPITATAGVARRQAVTDHLARPGRMGTVAVTVTA